MRDTDLVNTVLHYHYVDTPSAMAAALSCLKAAPALAVDFEMENQYRRYGLHMALIQLSTPEGRHFIFDALADIDFGGLGELLTDGRRETIIHDAVFDRSACRQVYGWRLRHLFDTRVAAQLCGLRRFGLGSLLEELLGLKIDKGYQTTDWLKRPLPKGALDYAAHDTAHLHALRAVLAERLTGLGRMEWAREEFALLEVESAPEADTPLHLRIKRSSRLTPRHLAVLKHLVAVRDELARAVNRPVHFIVSNEVLLKWAAMPPADESALRATRAVHPALRRAPWSRRFFEALAEGSRAPEESHPLWNKPRLRSPGAQERLKTMQAFRTEAAAVLNVEPHLLLCNDVLEWCSQHPGEALPPAVQALVRRWQRSLVAPEFSRRFGVAL